MASRSTIRRPADVGELFRINNSGLPRRASCWRSTSGRGLRDGMKRPVMVWLHGGGFTVGSGSSELYDGANLCNKGDVIVVTLNHRLNLFGYLHLAGTGASERFVDSGNAGMLDIVEALRWIADNIAEFGGDPGNVTNFRPVRWRREGLNVAGDAGGARTVP
jgi:hypothetical protein